MKIGFLFFIKLGYYSVVLCLMRYLPNHITEKNAVELLNFWEALYKQKISQILNKKNNQLFN